MSAPGIKIQIRGDLLAKLPKLMSQSATTIPAPAAASGTTTTAAATGEALFVGNYGRAVEAQLTPALVTNKLNSLSAHYDSAGQ